MPPLEGLRKGYANDIPTKFYQRVDEKVPCDFRTERSA